MKRMNFKSNGDLSVVLNDDASNGKDFVSNVLVHDVSPRTAELFSDMTNEMLARGIVEVHIEQNNNILLCHEVTTSGSVNVCSAADYPTFGCIDDWASDFDAPVLPPYVDPTEGSTE